MSNCAKSDGLMGLVVSLTGADLIYANLFLRYPPVPPYPSRRFYYDGQFSGQRYPSPSVDFDSIDFRQDYRPVRNDRWGVGGVSRGVGSVVPRP